MQKRNILVIILLIRISVGIFSLWPLQGTVQVVDRKNQQRFPLSSEIWDFLEYYHLYSGITPLLSRYPIFL